MAMALAGEPTPPTSDSGKAAGLQSSLNNFQADANADGSYTLVMCAQDPGVHNWLDTGGVQIGTLDARWQLLPSPDSNLSISGQLVNFQDLASVLPPQMPRVDPAQRANELKQRNAALLRRFRVPYPAGHHG